MLRAKPRILRWMIASYGFRVPSGRGQRMYFKYEVNNG